MPGARFVFGYEEALGYAVGDVVRDKDGIGAALAMLAVAAEAKAAGRSVLDRYDELERAHGVHLTSQVTLRTADQARVMRRLRADPPAELGGQPVTALVDLAGGGRQRAAEGGRADLPAGRRPGGAPPERHRAENQVLHRGGGAAGRAVAAGPPGSRPPGGSLRCGTPWSSCWPGRDGTAGQPAVRVRARLTSSRIWVTRASTESNLSLSRSLAVNSMAACVPYRSRSSRSSA